MGSILSFMMFLSGLVMFYIIKKDEIKFKFFKNKKSLPVDKFLQNVLYDKKFGYYSSKIPFGEKGDFITAPTISNLFSELISIWIISTWENLENQRR